MRRHDEYRGIPVGDLTDEQLLFDRGQIRISIQCGVTSDYRLKLEARELEINRELAKRVAHTKAAHERIETARST